MMTTGIATKATPAERMPAYVASWSGTCEKDAIASSEKRSMRLIVYLVSPAWRASRSYCTAVCLKPTHTVIPRRKRERSVIESRASRAGGLVARVAGAVHPAPPPVFVGNLIQKLGRAVGTAVVDQHQLEVVTCHRRARARYEVADQLLLVEDGRHDAEQRGPARGG